MSQHNKPLSLISLALLAALLAGCASRAPQQTSSPTLPSRPAGGWPDRDGPDAVIPPDLHKVPDALPRLENIRKGGPNKPYEVLGQRYQPMTEDAPLVERGLASWYGRKFHGRPTSSGEVYNMYAMTAAHPTMPIPSYARVRNPKNGREVIVRVNDRGPFHAGRIIDLSYTAALKLDLLRGVAPVELERLTYEDIRTGAWMRGNGSPEAAPLPAAEPPPVYVASAAPGAPEPTTTANVAPPPAAEPAAAPAPQTQAKIAAGFWVQLGAYGRLDGAEAMRQQVLARLDWLAPLLAVVRDKGLHRLQAGPYSSREDARQAAERLRGELALQPLVVERR
ncbi:septal ring lytic transglycosylase RlpA family protein [Roseateles sp. DAIF2]|uniref:septal ring lytic transglycosylase RlpA family protein n=1 Tax=Roseateles sp. DAIF2 TaxID=2714952 RepID=UPI0018A32C75|nr:septal ring lytic transglycosylase RlpA family protein [Roseateles sp. DAIF2]QPF71738.1 septal ring lytic transglycosylase RlpA family protein [Roseateles sp. DAIF2]